MPKVFKNATFLFFLLIINAQGGILARDIENVSEWQIKGERGGD